MPLVEFRDVSYEVDGRPVLSNVTFQVNSGETFVLLGRSGSGKTTILKLTNGMLFPSAGQVLVDGHPTTAHDPIRLKRSIGYVIQEGGLFPHFTVGGNVGILPKLEGWPEPRIEQQVRRLLDSVGLPADEFLARFPRQLSGGQRQRVGVARALGADPALLLFDEPFGALDPVTRRELQDQFLSLRRTFHKTSIFVTHDVQEALRLASRIGLLVRGRLELIAEPPDFRRAETAEARAFLSCIDV
jgi:osmoprotectant transport system ATP-binding protein